MRCGWCNDTKIHRGKPCEACAETRPLLELAEKVDEALEKIRRAKLHLGSLSLDQMTIVSLIVRHSKDDPIQIKAIASRTGLSGREIKRIVHDLRAVHLLPIASQRGSRAGYYWADSWEDWEPYARQYKAQALEEFKTVYRVTRHIWPDFAGQLGFDFARETHE